jgi:hypothetical protein
LGFESWRVRSPPDRARGLGMLDPDPGGAPVKPTAKQLRYLRDLANSRGQTFRYPETRAQASAEIRRLRAQQPDSRLQREVERREGQRAVQSGELDATAVRPDEIQGYGSHARWAGNEDAR